MRIMSRRCSLLIMMFLCFYHSSAQETKDSIQISPPDSILNLQSTTNLKPENLLDDPYDLLHLADDIARIWRHTGRKVKKEVRKFNAIDTSFIAPNKYNLAFMLERSTWFEHCRLGGTEAGSKQNISFGPNPDFKVGIYFGWRWIFLGYTFDLNDALGKNKNKKDKTELELSIYSSKFGVDLYYRKTGSNFKIRSYNGFNMTEEQKNNMDWDFNGLQCRIKGMNAYWIFNYKEFSYPAIYSQSTNQKKSVGSFMAGFSYSQNHYIFDYTQLPYIMGSQLNEAMKFNEAKYTDYSLNFGYGYNWVFAKNCAANLSLLPAIGYKKSKLFADKEKEDDSIFKFKWMNNINFDLIGRAGIVWNNSKYFIGASVVTHTYNYQKENFSVSNSFATLRMYAGFNFWKR